MKAEDKHALKIGIIFFALLAMATTGIASVSGAQHTSTISLKAKNPFGVVIWTHSLQVNWQTSAGKIVSGSHYAVHSPAAHAGLRVKSQSLTKLYDNHNTYVHYQGKATFGTWYMNSASSELQIKAYADGTSWKWSNLL